MRKTELIFLPAPAPGHLVSTVEFVKRLIAHDAHLSITVLVINSPLFHPTSINNNNQTQETDSSPRATLVSGAIRFIDLPQVTVPPSNLFEDSLENAFSLYLASHKPHVRDAVTTLLHNSSSRVSGLFLDMFCNPLIDVAIELGIPSYVFFCSGAAFLGLILHLPDQSEKAGDTLFDESDPETVIPSFQNPAPTGALPAFAFNKLGYKAFMEHAKRFRETKGIIVNTCAELEPYAVKSLSHAYQTAQVYTVGPVLDLNGQVRRKCDAREREQILQWLDKQPECSVVFLCFGSEGSMSEDQIKEISKGLTQSGQRFLWSLRKPPTGDSLQHTEYAQAELKHILRDNQFWSMVEGERGMICGWAPQVEILAHKATGAFVSHCGWNSTLESMWFGKPMVTWPLYAEQQIIAFEVARELGVAVELTLDYNLRSGDLVEAGDVERAVKCVMEKDNPVRCRAEEMKEVCRMSLMEGGSSLGCVDRLIRGFTGDTELNANS